MTPCLAIDLGGTKILAALVQGAQVLARAEAPTVRGAGPEAWLATMAALTNPWAGRWGVLGITVTGLVRDGCWSALNPATLDIPDRFPLAARAAALLGRVPVLANDAQAAAWGEYVHGAGQGQDMAFVTVSTGVGGGLVLGGRLVTGRGGLAGHLGQLLPPDGQGPRMEDGCAGRWIAAQAAAAGHPGDARHVTAAAQGGARWAQAILAISAARVARACHNLQLTIDPALIVIGGGIGLSPGYLDRVIAALDPLPAPQRPALARAALGADAGAIGIAALATQSQTTNREHST